MTHLIPIPFLVATVTILIWADLRSAQKLVYVFKPLSTLLVILVAILSLLAPGIQPFFTFGIVAGLVLSLGGDVALMFKSSKAFMIGLIFFFLAHVIYAVFFTLPNGFHTGDLISGALLLIVAVAIYRYLKPGLGAMEAPVIAYIAIICFMVNRASSAFFGTAFSPTQAWLLTVGALLFMLSDLILAANRFRQPLKYERFSLAIYYAGQLLIALSPAYF